MNKGLRFRIFARDGFTCRYCGAAAPNVVLHVDHIQPQSQGGTDAIDNLVTACRSCNLGKRDLLLSPELASAITAALRQPPRPHRTITRRTRPVPLPRAHRPIANRYVLLGSGIVIDEVEPLIDLATWRRTDR